MSEIPLYDRYRETGCYSETALVPKPRIHRDCHERRYGKQNQFQSQEREFFIDNLLDRIH